MPDFRWVWNLKLSNVTKMENLSFYEKVTTSRESFFLSKPSIDLKWNSCLRIQTCTWAHFLFKEPSDSSKKKSLYIKPGNDGQLEHHLMMELIKSTYVVESFECRDIDYFAHHSPQRPFALPSPPATRDARPAQALWKIAAPKIFKTALPRPKQKRLPRASL